MCRNCKSAGMANADGNYTLARTFHESCLWPHSCTCQHATGTQYRRDVST